MIEASSASSSSSSSSAAAEASDLDLSQLPSFTFLPGISTSDENQVPQEFEELWPHKGSTTDQHRWEIESSLGEILKEELASFRGTLNLPHQSQSLPLRELLWGTTEDLQCTNIKCTSCIQISEINRESTHQVLFFFYKVLKSVEYSWEQNHSANCGNERDADLEDLDSQQLGERVLERLKYMNSLAKKKLDLREDSVNAVVPWNQQNKPSYLCRSQTSTPGLQEILDLLDMPPPLRPIRVKPERKLKATDRQQLSFHMVPLVLDQNPRPMLQTDQIDTNLILDSVDNMMSMAANSNSTIQTDGSYDLEIKTPGATIHASAPSMLHNRSLLQSPAALPRALTDVITPSSLPIYRSKSMGQILQDTSKDNDGSDEISKYSNATILRAQTLPILHLRVPSPPSLPMMLMKGVYMPSYDPLMSMEPIAFAITVDNFDDYLMSNMSVDGCDTSGALLSMAPPSTPTLRLTEAPPQSPPSPPTSPPPLPVQKKDMPISPAPLILTPPPPPQPPGVSAPAPPPPPPIKGSTSSSPSPPSPPQASGSAPFPPSPSQASGAAPPPPSPSQASGVAPPPPPMAMNALRAKNNTKLKRSSQMGSLYRLLKGKVEGASLTVKTSHQRKSQLGGKSGKDEGQGMADALAEITKRSSYFQQILEDVNKYSAEILELNSAISSFKTKDMTELVKFRQHVEMQLEKLSDESQVLARFEDFPTKKLETIRMAVALFSKLEVIVTTLKSWKVVSPVTKQLDKIETYFNKMKEEVDIIDRNKDEECKRFKSHNIELDFNVVVRIKECMVDLSSTCIEVALKESEEAKKAAAQTTKSKTANLSKMLWRAFQLAFRVYNFAGGQDERADRLTHELAREIENQPQT